MKRFSPIMNERIREIAKNCCIKVADIYTVDNSYLEVELDTYCIAMRFLNHLNEYLKQWDLEIISVDLYENQLSLTIM